MHTSAQSGGARHGIGGKHTPLSAHQESNRVFSPRASRLTRVAGSLPARLRVFGAVFRESYPRERARIAFATAVYLMRRVPVLRRVAPREVWIKVQGAWFRIAPGHGELDGFLQAWVSRVYECEPELVAKPGDVVVDGGANVGFYATRQALRGARVVAFEPNPLAFARLSAALERNGHLDLVTAIPSALSDGSGRRSFYLSNDSLGGSLFTDAADAYAATEIDVATVDDTIRKLRLDHVDLLKLDVEGAEVDALNGARESLGRARGVVLEYHSPSLRNQCRQLLEDRGFRTVLDDGHHLAFVRAGQAAPRLLAQ